MLPMLPEQKIQKQLVLAIPTDEDGTIADMHIFKLAFRFLYGAVAVSMKRSKLEKAIRDVIDELEEDDA